MCIRDSIKIVYQHRVSNEFLRTTEEKQLDILKAYNDGFAKKVARAIDIMAMHGVNPADLEASGKIGENHLDTVTSVQYTEGQPKACLLYTSWEYFSRSNLPDPPKPSRKGGFAHGSIPRYGVPAAQARQ